MDWVSLEFESCLEFETLEPVSLDFQILEFQGVEFEILESLVFEPLEAPILEIQSLLHFEALQLEFRISNFGA